MVTNNKFNINEIKLTVPEYSKNKDNLSSAKTIDEINKLELIKEIKEISKTKKFFSKRNFHNKDLVFFGMGGSSLGIKTIIQTLSKEDDFKKNVFLLDNLDGEEFERIFDKINIKSTNFVFISKSGSTFEIKKLLKETIKKLASKSIKISSSIYFITENNNGYLNKFGKKENIPTFYINPYIGGRFSVLSKCSLIPCQMMDINWKKIIMGALSSYEIILKSKFTPINSLANFYYKNLNKGKTNTGIMSYKNNMEYFGEWFMQLWGESLGKISEDGVSTGLTPMRYLGPKDQHSQMQLILDGPKDKTLTVLSIKNNKKGNSELNRSALKEKNATVKALNIKKIPCVEVEINRLSEESLGSLLIVFQLTTIILAKKMKVNPFDQPAVELIKKNLTF